MLKSLITCTLGLLVAACATPRPTWSAAGERRVATPLEAATTWLLHAEQQQFDGDLDAARQSFRHAIALADEVLLAETQSSAAHRIRGRALLRQYPEADLAAALAALENAVRIATDPVDRQRATDLIEFANGLAAWLDRRPSDALEAWARIANPDLRASIDAEIAALSSDVALVELTIQ
jgi:hypothetical protein